MFSAESYCLAPTKDATVAAGPEQLQAAPAADLRATWFFVESLSGLPERVQVVDARQDRPCCWVRRSMRGLEIPAAFHQKIASGGAGEGV